MRREATGCARYWPGRLEKGGVEARSEDCNEVPSGAAFAAAANLRLSVPLGSGDQRRSGAGKGSHEGQPNGASRQNKAIGDIAA
jgi:hypothetical protein